MKVTVGDTIYDVTLPGKTDFKLSYREGVEIEKATGKAFMELDESSSLLSAGAIIWTLVRRQNKDVEFDSIDFELEDFFEESKEPETDEETDPTMASPSTTS